MDRSSLSRLPGALATLMMVVVCGAMSASAGCGVAAESEAVYEEIAPIADDDPRDFAYRLTVHQYGDRVGGHVEFYELDGIRNTRDRPYVGTPHSCFYFGPHRIRSEEFILETEGLDSSLLLAFIARDGANNLLIDVRRFGGTLAEDATTETWTTRLNRVSSRANGSCPRTLSDGL